MNASRASSQGDLFGEDPLPGGLTYQANFVGLDEERSLLGEIERLPFRAFEFRGFTGKRRTVSFGWRYDFGDGSLTKTEDMPAFLAELRARSEAFSGIAEGGYQHVLITEYGEGAGIGWHKDRSVFGDVVGISLLSSCGLRLRRKVGNRWERRRLEVEARSVYLLRGPARTEWEHSIDAVPELRYSITFRNVLGDAAIAAARRSRNTA